MDSLRVRAERLAETFRSEFSLLAEVEETTAFLGGGSVPAESIPSIAVKLWPPFPGKYSSETEFARTLRVGDPAVLARIRGGAVFLDLRTSAESEEEDLCAALRQAISGLRE